MENDNKINEDAGEASSDGEEDFESADEGEAKEKSSRVSENTKSKKSTEPGDEPESENKDEVNVHSNKLIQNVHNTANQGDTLTISEEDTEEEIGLKSNPELSPLVEDQDIDSTRTNPDILPENIEAKETSVLLNEDNVKTTTDSIKESNNDKNTAGDSSESDKKDTSSGGWGSWGSWGAVLNQATASVTSSLSHVIETVETSLGIPDPGELEETDTKEEKNEVVTTEPLSSEMQRDEDDTIDDCEIQQETDKLCDSESFLSSWGLSSISNTVTSKGLELVTDGIDALETIGKKTMHVISDGDPGFRTKRNMFEKPTLSQTLREAKEKCAKEAAERKKKEVLESIDFNDEFDRYQGLAHLEALEILSKESESKIESMLIDTFEDNLDQAKAKLCDIERVFSKDSPSSEGVEEKEVDGEFAVEVGNCAMGLNLAFVPDKLNQTEEAVTKWLEECIKEQVNDPSSRTTEEIYSQVVTSLANITAKSIEVFRKVAEMILLLEEEEEMVNAEDRSVHLYKLTKIVTNRISSLSTSYAECLNTAGGENDDSDNITPVITEVYLESSNSSSHVQDAFKLLLPVLQVSVLKHLQKQSN